MTLYHAHLDSLTVPVHVPGRRDTWWITERQKGLAILIARSGDRWSRFTQRQQAMLAGYSLHGLNRALRSLASGGIVALATKRGRHGWTRAVLRAGVRLLSGNVPERGTTVEVGSSGVTLSGNIYDAAPSSHLSHLSALLPGVRGGPPDRRPPEGVPS